MRPAEALCKHSGMTRPAVVANDVHKQYPDVKALDGCSFHIDFGECVALLGPNGAGKTTVTEILEGYRKQDSGAVEVLGVDPAHGDRAWRSQLGIVLQSDRDLSDLTVLESVQHFAGYYPDPRDADEVIEAVGLSEKRTSRNEKLSGGQRRRLDVALGIVGRPKVLFLDEPTTGFDPEARREFWALIESLKDEGTTILLTTHYLEEAEQLADRVAVISRGRVLACDTPAQLGGRERSSARVSWLEDGVRAEIQTMEPARTIVDLVQRIGGEIPGLEVRRETLEDIYLGLIAGDRDGATPMVQVDVE